MSTEGQRLTPLPFFLCFSHSTSIGISDTATIPSATSEKLSLMIGTFPNA